MPPANADDDRNCPADAARDSVAMSAESIDPALETPASRLDRLRSTARAAFPGLAICLTIATAAQFLSDHYGAPQMLFALLLGLAFHFLSEDEKMTVGLDIAAKPLLRIGVALLGLRITVQDAAALGWESVLFLALGVVLTIVSGVILAWLTGRDKLFGILSGASVGICGASAALAVASVLPSSGKLKADTIFVVVTVTVLSTLAMIFYPMFLTFAGFSEKQSAFFLGATIHDVAQVVGAGYGMSAEVGDGATIVKLLRVAMLVPVVFAFSLLFRSGTAKARISVPFFIIAFCVLAVLNTLGLVAAPIAAFLNDLSRWMLVAAIVAIGIKTSLKSILEVGSVPVTIIIAETLLLALWTLCGTFLALAQGAQ
jgi:uncharacterized integral membrane protein (TIGR00698 family)